MRAQLRLNSQVIKRAHVIPSLCISGLSRNLISKNLQLRCFFVLCLALIVEISVAQNGEAGIVDALHKRKFKWLESSNTDSLNWLLADEVSYVHSNGWIQSRADVLADMQTGKLKYKSVTVENSKVSITDNTALVTGTGTFSGEVNGTAFSLRLLYTEVYAKTEGRWKLVGRHSCKVP